MKKHFFNVTYDLVTPESSEQGDTADNGFLDQSGGKRSVNNPPIWGEAAGELKASCAMTLRDAINLVGGPFENAGRWFTSLSPLVDYSTAHETSFSLHPPRDISAASYARLCRLFGVKA